MKNWEDFDKFVDLIEKYMPDVGESDNLVLKEVEQMLNAEKLEKCCSIINDVAKKTFDMPFEEFTSVMAMIIEEYCLKHELDAAETMHAMADTADAVKAMLGKLGCDAFDIATRKIGGTYYDMFVDDIGLFKPLHVSAVDKDCKPMLVGNIVFANHDDHGNTTDLSEEDIERICRSVLFVGYENGEMGMVVECEY